MEIQWMAVSSFQLGDHKITNTTISCGRGDFTIFSNFNLGVVRGTLGFSLKSCQSFAGAGLQGRVATQNALHEVAPAKSS